MLYEFINTCRDDILARTGTRLRSRAWPSMPVVEVEHGVALFLTQLSETLRLESTPQPFLSGAIGGTAARHGAELLLAGFTLAQVVHDYGDICQAITEVAIEHAAPITVEEFHTMNRCLDTAIAEAVTEHSRLNAEHRAAEETERLGRVAHESRDFLNGALLAFHALKRGTVAINGSTGAVLGRSLTGLGALIDRVLSQVRLEAVDRRRERLAVNVLVDEIAAAGILHAESRQLQFIVTPVQPQVVVEGDAQLLTSAVMNLLHNAFKHTPEGGSVTLRAYTRRDRVLFEIEDECGGLPEGNTDLFQPFGERRGADRSGLGLGLSIARQAVRGHQGEIHVSNMPPKGCMFTIDLPAACTSDLPSAIRPPRTVAEHRARQRAQ